MPGALTLGGIEFEGFELPDKINQGGAQTLATRKLIGGDRVIDAMGPDDAQIKWSGVFFGETAQLRALRIDMLRRSGRKVELTFGLRAYEVVVAEFAAEIDGRPTLVRYDIACEVVRDLVAGTTAAEADDIAQSIEMDLAAAEAEIFAREATQFAISMASQAVRAALGDKGAQRGTLYVATAVAQDLLGNAIFEATGDGLAADAGIAAVQGVAGVIQGGDPIVMAAGLVDVTGAVGASYQARTVVAALQRSGRNLAAHGDR